MGIDQDSPGNPLRSDLDADGNAIRDASLVNADSAILAQELGLPAYDDVSNAPQTQGRLVYATGSGTSAEGIYKHDGAAYTQAGGTGEWEEDGSGNIVPIDGETVGDGTTSANHQSVNTGSLNNGGPVSDGDGVERQVWIIANGASDPAGADAEDIIFEEQA